MKSRLLAGVTLLTAWFVWAVPAVAVEPYLEFTKGLRDRGYFDYAVLYLDQIAGKSNTPAEVKQVIPYEKAMTLLTGSKSTRSPEKRLEQLDQALAFLEQFVAESPRHPYAADANSDRAQILLDKGRAEVLQSKSPANQGTKRAIQERARGYITKARQVYQTAFDQHEANYKTFPAFIDKATHPEQAAARAKVETNLITASLSLGMCTYEEAQTYDPASNDFKQLLTKAAEEFEKMHQKYRSQVGGLYARAWQGKCFEEQKELQKALGIYNELLGHQGDDPALSALKTQTLYFKLICLNSKERHDHQLVVDQAEEWVKKHQNESRTNLGLGIQWEQALAYEALGDNKDIIQQEKERYWRQARTIALQIQKFPSEYRDASTSMLQRLTVKLGKGEIAPKDFATANSIASNSVKMAQELKREIDEKIKLKAPKDEIDKLQLDYTNELNEAARNFELAFSLLKRDDDKKEILNARLFYAYVNFWQRKNYETAVLAEYVAKTASKDDTLALDAAYLTMAALAQAFNDNKAPIEKKGEDMDLVIKACNLIANRWPASEKANEAYMILGRMYERQKKPAKAAEWFGKIPETDPKYPEAQMAAGQAYWLAYLSSSRLVGMDKPKPEEMDALLKSAEAHLQRGVDKISKQTSKETRCPQDLAAGKMSLAQIFISQGRDALAIKILADDPHSVVKAVKVPEDQRPETGITSRKFAIEVHKLLLRGYIGTGNLEKAREEMKELEEISAAGGIGMGSDITELYVSLGKQLKDELERLKANGENERHDNLMKSFETLLSDIGNRKDGQTFGSLSWLGEMYLVLGEMNVADPGKATAFFDKAQASLNSILEKANAEAGFVSPLQLYGTKLRLVGVYRLKKEFEPAETLIGDVLKQNANNLTAQKAAAELYQDWGNSGQTNSTNKLKVAIGGDAKIGAWGWGQIGVKLQKSAEFGTNPEYMKNFLDARYNGVKCRQQYAQAQSVKEKQKQLEICRSEMVATISVIKEISDEQYARFNALFREILQQLNATVVDLPRTKDVEVVAPVKKSEIETATEAKAAAKAAEAAAAPPPPQQIDTMTWVIFGICLVAGIGAVLWVLVKGKPVPKAKSYGSLPAAGPASFAGMAGMPDLPPATFAAPKPKPRPASGAKPTEKPAEKPPAKPTAAGTGGAVPPKPKPKPKPPAPPAG